MPMLNFQQSLHQSSVQYADLVLKHFIIIIINVVLLFVKFVKTVIIFFPFLMNQNIILKKLAVLIL